MRIDNAEAYDLIEWAARIVAMEIPAGGEFSGRDKFLFKVQPFLDACQFAYEKGREAGRTAADDHAAYKECRHAIVRSFEANALNGNAMPAWIWASILSRWDTGRSVGQSESTK